MIVEKKSFRLAELQLEHTGQTHSTLREVEVGYETYGTLNADGTNAILICHYFSGTSHCAGRYSESETEAGYWDSIIGAGKAIDTDKYFVVSSDVISNVNAKAPHVISTGPSSKNPETGHPYGSKFPIITIGDLVTVQKALVDSLGIKHLHAVAGPSMGSLQSYEWSVRFPDFVDRVMIAICPGLSADPYVISELQQWCTPIFDDPNFQGGDYYGTGREPLHGLAEAFKLITFTALRQDWALRLFGRGFAGHGDPRIDINARFSIDHFLDEAGRNRALTTDANAVLRIARANQLFSIQDRKKNIKSKFLMLPAATDLLFPPVMCERGAKELRELGVSVEVFPLEGTGGHLDGLTAIAQAADVIRGFMDK